MIRQLLIIGNAGLLAACGSSIGLDQRSTAVTVAGDLPPPDPATTGVSFADYRIGPADVIAVSVFDAKELDRQGSVDSAGNFAMPLIGSVAAAGKTPEELAAFIADKLRGDYIKNPQVAVNVVEVKASTVTIDGAVRRPGIYPVIGALTLQQAIATALGASDTADTDRVIVFRTVNGEKLAALFDLKDIRSGREPDPRIYASDIVVVGEDATRRFMRDSQLGVPLLSRFVPVL